MSQESDGLSFGVLLSELVSEVENQLPVCGAVTSEGFDTGLGLPELLLEASHCCRLATRVYTANVSGLVKIRGLFLSQ